jgi:hypothetical protein
MSYLKYFWYVVRHKFWVIVAGRKLGVSLWRCFTHDLSKFRPSEFFPYADYFYGGPYKPRSEMGIREFDAAWLKHQHRNPHHWQHWLLREDDGPAKPIDMPRKYAKEMVADWMGAGRAITGKWGISEWYAKNKYHIILSEGTQEIVNYYLSMPTGE